VGLYLAINPISNKLPEHGASLTVDVSGCTCQVINSCLNVMPLPRTAKEVTTPLSAIFLIFHLVDHYPLCFYLEEPTIVVPVSLSV